MLLWPYVGVSSRRAPPLSVSRGQRLSAFLHHVFIPSDTFVGDQNDCRYAAIIALNTAEATRSTSAALIRYFLIPALTNPSR